MGGPLIPPRSRGPLLSLRAYLVGLILVCAVPAVAFSVWLTIAVIGPAATPWMSSLGVLGAAVLLAALGLATVAGRAIVLSLTRLGETAGELARDLEAAGQAREQAERGKHTTSRARSR